MATVAFIMTGSDRPDAVIRQRRHALAHFCAAFGHSMGDPETADVTVRTTGATVSASTKLTWTTEQVPLPLVVSTPDAPDLLAELSFWLGGAGEHLVTRRDMHGRICYPDSFVARLGLNPRVPWASHVLRRLQEHVERVGGVAAQPRRVHSPWIAATHDVDFLRTNFSSGAARVGRNLAQSILQFRSFGQARGISLAILRGIRQRSNPVAGLEPLLARELEIGVRSTWNFIPERIHRRDGNYELGDPAFSAALSRLRDADADIGVHGSYESAYQPRRLATEYALLESAAGVQINGGRQHWLRGDTPSFLEDLEHAGAKWDSTYGWSDQPGFRHGFAQPYLPFDMTRMVASTVIEIPLVVMDTSLGAIERAGGDWRSTTDEVLRAACAEPGAGVAILWHDTAIGGGQLPAGVGEYYWSVVDEHQTRIVSASDLWQRSNARFDSLDPGRQSLHGEP